MEKTGTKKLLKLIASLTDPQLGSVGAQLRARFNKAACKVEQDPAMVDMLAVHTSFVYPPATGESSFKNKIHIGAHALRSPERHFAALVHEATHATQYASAAILHASPYNSATNIILCPRDFVMACERAEQDAYVRQALFASLLRQKKNLRDDFTGHDPVPAPLYESLRALSTPLEALRTAALMLLARPGFYSRNDKDATLADSYHELALTAYQDIIATRRAANPSGLQFVRMEERDILDIGRSYGPSLFGDHNKLLPAFAGPPQLSPQNRLLLDKLNAQLGITDENNLPCFSDALNAQGLSRESFLAYSRRHKNQTGPSIRAATSSGIAPRDPARG